jgi:phage replication initiation protein
MEKNSSPDDGMHAGAGEVGRARTPTAAAPEAYPRIVTTGGNPGTLESKPAHQLPEAHIDWLALTVFPGEDRDMFWLHDELQRFLTGLTFEPTGKGWNGYSQRHNILHAKTNANLGLVAHGGEFQRGSIHVELNAQACALIKDWQQLKDWAEANTAQITRIDLAHDDFEGKFITVDLGRAWHKEGKFNQNGRPAKGRFIDDLGTGDGRTLYIGRRANGKLLRIYEKGKQLDDPDSPWVRVEVELRNKSRFIPWDALIHPGYYLAGAYPCLCYLSTRQEKIKTIAKATRISYGASVDHLRQAGGKLINLMMEVNDGDAFAVVNRRKRDGIPRRLAPYVAVLENVLEMEE